MFWRFAGCLFLVFVLSACGTSPTAPSASLAGRWQGTFTSTTDGPGTDGPGTITLQLTQSGLNVTGMALLTQNEFTDVPGTVTGTLAGSSSPTTMTFVVSYAYGLAPCQGSFSGTLDVTNRELDGPFHGQNCVRSFNGSLHATKSD
jgi:hypothetical protein